MQTNRSMPTCAVIPVFHHPDVDIAIDWLRDAFGFSLRWRIGHHRAQLHVGSGCVVVTEGPASPVTSEILVRILDADAHHARAVARGVVVDAPPKDFAYGERQYTARDIEGHVWMFSQSIADVDPADWGAEVGSLTECPGAT